MNFARIREIARLEWRFNVTRPLFAFLSLLIGLFAWGMSTGHLMVSSGDSTTGGKKAFLTSMFATARVFTIIDTMLFALFLAIVAGMPVLRDQELRTTDLLRSTPLKPKEYVFGKFLGVLGVYIAAMVVQIALTVLFNHGFTGPEDAEFIGPLRLANYLLPTLAFVLPTSIFFAACSFSIGTLTRRPALIFILPIVFLVGLVAFVWESASQVVQPWINTLLLYADPSGYRWLNETYLRVDLGVDYYNVEPIGFDAAFVASRLGIVAFSLLLVLVTALWVERRERASATTKIGLPTGEPPRDVPADESSARPARMPHMTVAQQGALSNLAAVFRLEAIAMLKHPALWLFVPLFALQICGNVYSQHSFLEAIALITPGYAAANTLSTLATLVVLLLLFFMVESLHREQGERLAGIVYSTPVRTPSLLVGKILASAVVAVAVLIACGIGFVILMLVQGRVPIEIGPFVLLWGVVLLPTYILWSAFVAAMYGITGSRLATYGIALGALFFTWYEVLVAGSMSWVFNWNFASSPIRWSDFGALDFNRSALIANRIVVLLAAVFFSALAVKFFPRTERDSTRSLQRMKPGSLAKGTLRLSWAIVPVLVAGIWLHMRIQAGFQGDQAEKAQKDYWRRNVQTWTNDVTPDIEHADLDFDLRPDAREISSRGEYRLVNAESKPMREFALTPGLDWRDVKWSLNGADFTPEDFAGLKVVRLPKPLAPGEKVNLGWSFTAEIPGGYTENGGGSMEFVLPTSVVLTSFGSNLAPMIGYQEGGGIDEDNKSDAKEYADDFYEGVTRSGIGNGAPFTVKTTIHGPTDFRLNGCGALVSDVVENDRRTTVWETDQPIRFFNIVAGKGLIETKGEGTALWSLPSHSYNVPEMMEALNAARKYYSEWFYPYPWKELKVTEFAAHADYAQGFPTNITFSESIGFLLDSTPKSNLAFLVTAHECAHQWWGNLLNPGEGPGTNILSEGMAHFSTALLIGQVKGDFQRMEFLKRIEQKYNDDRQADSERSSVKIDGSRPGDTTCTYDKPGFVFWMLLNELGRDRMLEGCRTFIEKFRLDRDHAALQDLIHHLRDYATDKTAYDAFTKQWFFEVVVPRFKVHDAEKAPPSDGPWMVTGKLENRGTGRMKVEVAAASGPRFDDDGVSLPDYKDARRIVEIGAGETVAFEIACDFEPAEIVVDPDMKMLQLFRKEAKATFPD